MARFILLLRSRNNFFGVDLFDRKQIAHCSISEGMFALKNWKARQKTQHEAKAHEDCYCFQIYRALLTDGNQTARKISCSNAFPQISFGASKVKSKLMHGCIIRYDLMLEAEWDLFNNLTGSIKLRNFSQKKLLQKIKCFLISISIKVCEEKKTIF